MKPVLVLYTSSSSSKMNQEHHDYNNKNDHDESDDTTTGIPTNVDDVDTMKEHMIDEQQRIPLHEYTSKEELHTLFWNLGFTQKSDVEQQYILEQAQQVQYHERLQHHIRLEYYKWRTIYVNEFRTRVMGMSLEAYQAQTQYLRLTCHPSGPIPDLLQDQYDRINQNIAGANKEDRYLYAVRYLENRATVVMMTT